MIDVTLGEVRVTVTDTVFELLYSFRQLDPDSQERGGILMGQVDLDGHRVLISRASVPTEFDLQSRTSFIRDRNWAQYLIEYEYLNSAKRNTYLGEWHTHPAGSACPSNQDVHMLKEQFERNSLHTDEIYLLIVAFDDLYIGKFDGGEIAYVNIAFPSS